MRRASFLTLLAVVALLIAGAVGVYAYDSSRSDLIADGVSVAGVDVGGMRAAEARAVLKHDVARPLRKPVRVKVAGRAFELSPEDARLKTDVDGMVDDALAESRAGSIVSRTVRGLAGGSTTAQLPSRVSYSKDAVTKLVEQVKSDVDRAAQDATVEPSGDGLTTVPSRKGLEVKGRALERQLAATLELPGGDRQVKARTKVLKPEVTTAEVADRYPVYLTVDRASKELRFYKRLKLAKTYRIAVGRAGFDTPAGLYNIESKAVDPAWSAPEWAGRLAGKTIPGGAPNNPLKARWLGIYDGAGIHGTTDVGSLGTAASHGCIRMSIPEVKELYDRVPVSAPVYIS